MRVSTRIANKTFGKWNGIYATNGEESYVFRANASKIYPEDPEDYRTGFLRSFATGMVTPVRTDIDITNDCGDDCVMCFARELKKKYPGSIPYERAKKIINDTKKLGGVTIRLTGGGEALNYSHFKEIVQYMGELDFKTMIETNGDLIDLPGYSEVIAKNIHHLRVSVDSGDDESRLKVHRPKNKDHDYTHLLKNIEMVKKEAVKQGREKDLFMGATFVVLPENYTHVKKFIEDMHNLGINWVAIRKNIYRKVYEDHPYILSHVRDQMEGLSIFDPNFTIVGQYGVSFKPREEEFDECWVSYVRNIILADSSLHTCCLARNLIMPNARMGEIGDGEYPLIRTMKNNYQKFTEFREKSPQGCKFCIDLDNNITFSHMVELLIRDENFEFYRANVQHSLDKLVNGIEHVIPIPLEYEDYKAFNRGKSIKMDSEIIISPPLEFAKDDSEFSHF
jgi:MoaA/NifB/PqqE/SkfB family radical SAM enzyme